MRVTDPKTVEDTTRTSGKQPARQKDPKKVAAGHAGAAARKAKQAHLLEELRKAKESQYRRYDHTAASSGINTVASNGAPPVPVVAPPQPQCRHDRTEEKDETTAVVVVPTQRDVVSLTPWIMGAAAGLGLIYWAASRRTPVDPPTRRDYVSSPPTKSATPSAQQLKVPHNPFYME